MATTIQPSIFIKQDRDPKLGRIWVLRASQTLPRPVDEVFPFFADAHNLEKLTPSFLKFNVLTPRPIDMQSGTQIRYKLKVRGLPIYWKTTILDWDPPRQFVDTQDSGPYALWHHTHIFEPTKDGSATVCTDTVRYKPKGWFLAGLINKFFVQRDVENIFRYRFDQLDKIFSQNEDEISEPALARA
jgi:ligand-binding SRPBCC domain-containing protein